ncbi:kynureninase [Enemella dayhoffiae]|uniref:Kynureninase n=2 Tax=Enemella dayhoffiae TaxID=2016507 RepID=A0A255GYM0_9ACTN|nr:kynureninase [Enemella dayhoffiae]
MQRAHELDAADPLAECRDLFVPARSGTDVVKAYLDGNSLGRPLKATRQRLIDLVDGAWGTRLIRSWDEQWMELPFALGDELARVCLGAAAGQTCFADSTTVLLYKLLRAAVDAAPWGRSRIVVDTQNFPTDRYVAEAVAAERGHELVWIEADPAGAATAEQVAEVVDERTSVVLLSHVAYKSAQIADLPRITEVVHAAGSVVLWDLCHSVGVVPIELDRNQVDLAVGCSYKYLNGGPGAPAFAYVAQRHQGRLRQPIQGWMGHARPFEMGPGFEASQGMRGFISGTPPVLAMVGIADTIELIDRFSLAEIRRKSVELTSFVVAATDSGLSGEGVRLVSPRDPGVRGGHVTLAHPRSRQVYTQLWAEGIIPDFREPDGIRLGLAPLSTSFVEVAYALSRIAELVDQH